MRDQVGLRHSIDPCVYKSNPEENAENYQLVQKVSRVRKQVSPN
jgi:hypothetical protein